VKYSPKSEIREAPMRPSGAAIGLSLLCLAPGGVLAQPAPADPHAYVIRYMGDVGCEDWLNLPDRTDFPRDATLNWVLGYLSRAAVARNVDLLAPADQAAITNWMNDYCTHHLRSTVLTGASSLEKEMADGRGPRSMSWP
jgi:hypothetical protein